MGIAKKHSGIRATDEAGTRVVSHGDRELFRYTYRPKVPQIESPRPFLHPIRTLAGILVTDARPQDHPWHAGLSLALAHVGTHNFWGGPTFVRGEGYVQLANNGSVIHTGFDALEEGEIDGSSTDERPIDDLAIDDTTIDGSSTDETLEWRAQDSSLVAFEQRRITTTVNDGALAWALGFATRLRNVSPDTLTLGSPSTAGRDNAGYGGLFLRASPDFVGGTFYTASGTGADGTNYEQRPDAMGAHAEWMALASDEATLMMLDAASNDGFPSQWFARNDEYAGLGPAPFFSREVELRSGDTLEIRYAAVIADGSPRHGVQAWLTDLAAFGRSALETLGSFDAAKTKP